METHPTMKTFRHPTASPRRPRRRLARPLVGLAFACLLIGCDDRERVSPQEVQRQVQAAIQETMNKTREEIKDAHRRGLWEGALVAGLAGLVVGAMLGSSARRAGKSQQTELAGAEERNRQL